MIAIKAGGSVITRSGRRPVFDRRGAARLASALAGLREPFVLVHGTGSFGKPPALRYGYLSGRISAGKTPVAAIRASLLSLHSQLVSELVRQGVKAVSCPGCSYFSLSGGRPRLERGAQLLGWLRRGFAPVINSDIFPAAGGGFRVVSSDALLGEACSGLGADLAVFLTGAAGVLDPDGEVIAHLERRSIPGLRRRLKPSPSDVSGGIRGKLSEISRIAGRGTPVAVLDGRKPAALLKLRSGSAGGTSIYG